MRTICLIVLFFFSHRKCHFHIECCLVQIKYIVQGFPGPVGKNPAAKAVDTGENLVWEDTVCCGALSLCPKTTEPAL